jgi:hypothetical protein
MIQGSVVCSSFKKELLLGMHDFSTNLFRIALYTAEAILDSNTVGYVTFGEATGLGYIQGGQDLLNAQVLLDPAARVAIVTFDDAIWLDSVISAKGALIYNQSSAQRAVAVIDFGVTRESNHGPFRVQFPPPGPNTALIRIY